MTKLLKLSFLIVLWSCTSTTSTNERSTDIADESKQVAPAEKPEPVIISDDTIYIGETREYKSLPAFFKYDNNQEYRDLVVLVDEGNYYADDDVWVSGENIIVEGIGQVNLYAREHANVMWVTGKNIEIRNFRMTHLNPGNPANQNCSGRVLAFDNAEDVLVEGCDLNGCGLAGLHDNVENSNIHIKENYIHNNSVAAITDIDGNKWNEEVDDHPTFTFENNIIKNNGPDRHREEDHTIALYTEELEIGRLVVERVTLVETLNNQNVSYIPRLRDLRFSEDSAKTNLHPVIEKINTHLLDRFMVNSYEQKEIEESEWHALDFKSQIKGSLLMIYYWGEYYNVNLHFINERLFYDLKTGEYVENRSIPFHTLFTMRGYHDFLDKHWLPTAKAAFAEALECAEGYEAYCNLLDIDSYSVKEGKFSFSLTDDCYPRAALGCTPNSSVSVPVDSVIPYLNTFGKKALFQDSITRKNGIDDLLYYKKYAKDLPNRSFAYAQIDGKYPIAMALEFKGDNGVEGYYYYENKKEKISLKGEKTGNTQYLINEYVNGKVTGRFTLQISEEYLKDAEYGVNNEGVMYYWKGTWSAEGKNQELPVVFEAIKM